jgi:hypothetical protein
MQFILPKVEDLKADCDNCQALCCMAHKHLRSEDFPITVDKPGGVPCENLELLDGFKKCSVYEKRSDLNFKICEVFDCNGAGQFATRFFTERFSYDWALESNLNDPRNQSNITKSFRYFYNLMKYIFESIKLKIDYRRDGSYDEVVYELLQMQIGDFFDELDLALVSAVTSDFEFDPDPFVTKFKYLLRSVSKQAWLIDGVQKDPEFLDNFLKLVLKITK